MKKNWVLVLIAFAFACSSDKSEEREKIKVAPETLQEVKVNLKLVRLEDEFFSVKTHEEVKAILLSHPRFVKEYLEVPDAAQQPRFLNDIFQLYSNPQLKAFYQDNQKFYGDFSDEKNQMASLFRHVKHFYPNYYVPEVNTIISGFRFDKDFSFSDSLIVVSIDYFLGKNARYRPQFYDYMLRRYEKPYIVPMMALAISSKYNEFNAKDETLLANMIHYGKAHYFLERTMPELPDSMNIQYTAEELKEANENIDVIWGHFIEKKLFYETNNKVIQRYVGESPKTVTIGDKCPGRIGRWLGWMIVRKYMEENPGVSLPQLMKESNAQELLKKSKFKLKSDKKS